MYVIITLALHQIEGVCSWAMMATLFQAEWEALELTDHQWALESVEEELMGRELDFDGMFSKELPTGIF